MNALDANVVLRLIVGDDRIQEAQARALIEAEPILVPLTVTLECEWVLRSFYKRTPVQIAAALDALTDVANLVFEHLSGVRWALDRLIAGADFADMIHIVQADAAGATGFATFDAAIEHDAGAASPVPAITIR